ncbi:hypothetical protein Tco_0683154 [Tanacetum coccineum]|uniref:Uncharacterized protein n=1 Tax=Tanacetum coccineum TaxID=301880 RepID=A0ABQ4XT68_9ASTR
MAPKRKTTRLNPDATPTPVTDTHTTTSITNAQIQAMINEGVTAALAVRDATRNGDDSHTSGTGARRPVQVARECTYPDFLKCQPLNFKGTEGVDIPGVTTLTRPLPPSDIFGFNEILALITDAFSIKKLNLSLGKGLYRAIALLLSQYKGIILNRIHQSVDRHSGIFRVPEGDPCYEIKKVPPLDGMNQFNRILSAVRRSMRYKTRIGIKRQGYREPDFVMSDSEDSTVTYTEDDVLPTEEQPLPTAVSPTADSPSYITKSNPEEDLEEDDEDPKEDPADYPTDRDDDDKEEEESSRDDDDDDKEEDENEDEEEEHQAPADSISPPIFCTLLGCHSRSGHYVHFHFRWSREDPNEIAEEIPAIDMAELGQRMTNFVTTIRQDTNEIYGRLDDAQDDRSLMSASREAWVQSMDASDMARSETQMAVLQSQQTPARDPAHPDVPEEADSRTTRSSPATTTITTTPMTDAQLKALIDQGIVDALAARDADRSQNGEDSHDY